MSEANDPSLDEFFPETNDERYFVKNIERVQGDERDKIIISVGYHKDPNGNLPYRFGHSSRNVENAVFMLPSRVPVRVLHFLHSYLPLITATWTRAVLPRRV